MGSAKNLFYLIVAAAVLGAVVLVLNKNYRIPYNVVSNRGFYAVVSEK